MPIITALLVLAVAVVFRSILHKPQDAVPLFVVPVFFYPGYITVKAGIVVWISVTVAITFMLAVLYVLT